MYSLLAIDLDGTLLDRRKKISQQNIDAISRYCKLGGKVVVLTGRAPVSVAAKVAEIEQRAAVTIDYYVCFNGAYVFDNVNKRVVATDLLPSAKLAYLHELARSRGYTLWMYTRGAVARGEMIATRSLITRGFIFSKRMKIRLDNKCPKDQTYKVNFIAYTPLGIRRLLKFMAKHMENDFEYFKTADWVVEVTNKGVTKAVGLKSISKLTGIPLTQMAGIGDSMNDLPFLQMVGLPIAPANAMTLIKKTAVKVVSDNNDSAVAKAIDLIISDANR